MTTLVLGCNGQLGLALAGTAPASAGFLGVDLPEVDISNASSVADACERHRPAVIVNAAAYTAVDRAESEPARAAAINADGAGNVAAAAVNAGARLIHVSTDFVFGGDSRRPYRPDDPPRPLNVYGKTKLDGEQAVLGANPGGAVVLRTAWLYSGTGSNFVLKMLSLMAERDSLDIVADQVGAPTWADSLARVVWAFAGRRDLNGLYHWTDGGQASWHEFALEIQEQALSLGLLGQRIPIRAIATEDYATPARRPPYSVLDTSATQRDLNLQSTCWRVNLRHMLERLAA